jgi:hypothetical protein
MASLSRNRAPPTASFSLTTSPGMKSKVTANLHSRTLESIRHLDFMHKGKAVSSKILPDRQ